MSYYSDYRYITLSEFKANYDYSSVSDANLVKYISKAEKLIDLYVGKQNKFIDTIYEGTADSGTSTTLIDSGLINFPDNYFTYCYLIVVDGTNAGEERFITSYSNSLTKIIVDIPFSSPIDNTSIYKIEQRSEFPRAIDFVSLNGVYYKYIPKEIKIATALQTEWIIKKGFDFIREGGDRFISEQMGAYSYQKGTQKVENLENLICPEVKPYLLRFKNRIGKIVI